MVIIKIDILISDYFDHKIDTTRFVLRYKKIILDICDIKEELKRKEDIPVNTAVKLSRLLKNQEYIDRIYNELLDKREHEDWFSHAPCDIKISIKHLKYLEIFRFK